MPPDLTTTLVTARGPVTIHSRADAPRRWRAADHRGWLASYWPELSAAAYHGYLRHGTGAVVLWTDARPRLVSAQPLQPERLLYTTQIHVLPGTTEADFDGWEARQLERYDPETEALVVFVEGGVVGYRAAGVPSPPHALSAARAAQN